MPNWFRPGPPPHQTALAMIGAKAGGRVLVVGADDPDLAAAVALTTGLNGQTLVVDSRADAASRVETAAARAGALVDFEQARTMELPAATGFDIAVIVSSLAPLPPDERASLMAGAVGALRDGGRIVVVDGHKRSGLLGALSRGPARLDSAVALAILQRAGLRATRQLADAEGVAFYEGRR